MNVIASHKSELGATPDGELTAADGYPIRAAIAYEKSAAVPMYLSGGSITAFREDIGVYG